MMNCCLLYTSTLYGYGYLEIHNLIGELKKYGLMAVETMYSTYNEKQSDDCLLYTSENIKKIDIYTDGACSGNPGSGGYGVVLLYNGARKELSAGYRKTTNNRMEVLAVIKGLEALKEKCSVNLYSDSKYVVDAVNKGWAKKWRANGWRKSDKSLSLIHIYIIDILNKLIYTYFVLNKTNGGG